MYRRLNYVQKICLAAMLCAIACLLAYFCKMFTVAGFLRFTFESLPLIITGIFLGPWWGFGCGIAADFLNTAISSYGIAGINPLITLGEGLIGLVAGLVFNYIFKKGNMTLRLLVTTFSAHLIGNIIVKSVALRVMYNYPLESLIWRVPTYLVIGGIEFALILVIMKTNVFGRIFGYRK